jgi:hypothetical protein
VKLFEKHVLAPCTRPLEERKWSLLSHLAALLTVLPDVSSAERLASFIEWINFAMDITEWPYMYYFGNEALDDFAQMIAERDLVGLLEEAFRRGDLGVSILLERVYTFMGEKDIYRQIKLKQCKELNAIFKKFEADQREIQIKKHGSQIGLYMVDEPQMTLEQLQKQLKRDVIKVVTNEGWEEDEGQRKLTETKSAPDAFVHFD